MDERYVPSYLEINEIGIITKGSQGSSSSYITDAWLYIDGADRGAYPLPASIPVLAEGMHTIKIAPGIKLNGVSGTRVPYPLMEPVEIEVDLLKDSLTVLSPKCRYFETTEFALIEDFEDINISFEPTINNKAEWRLTNGTSDPAEYIFEGFHSGGGFLNEDNSSLQVITKQFYQELPKQGIPVFIEMDFKCNTTMVISLSGYQNGIGESSDIIYLNPTDGVWKKIYINLTSTISYDVNVNDYKFLISAAHNPSLEESVVLVDNFKLLYRKID